MIALALLQATAAPVVATPPADWTLLPELPYERRVASPPDVSRFVRGEVAAGRCKAAKATATGWTVQIDLAIQLDAGNLVRRIVPRAIDCPTVEQYASGLVLAMARGNLAGASGWYRTELTFAWNG